LAIKLHSSMQKWLFFLLFASSLMIRAQHTVSIEELSFSLWVDQLDKKQFRSECTLTLRANQLVNEVNFNFLGNSIGEIRKLEGREKDRLPFKMEGGSLSVTLGREYQKGEEFSLKFYYNLAIPEKESIAAYDPASQVLAINTGAFMQSSQDVSSYFFPSLSQQEATIHTNISFPQEMSTMGVGKLQFVTDNGTNTSHYWSTEEKQPLKDFFLRVGSFKDHEIEELEDDPIISLIDPKAFSRNALKESLQPSIDYYATQTELEVSDSLIDAIDELSKEQLPLSLYLKYADIERNIDTKTFYQEQLLALIASDDDTTKASWLNLRWNESRHQKKWLNQLIKSKWPVKPGEKVPEEITTKIYFNYYQKDFKDTLGSVRLTVPDSVFSNFYDLFLIELTLPQVKVDYRYISSRKGLLIFIEQDTNLSRPYSFPLLARAYLKDTVVEKVLIAKALAKDTLLFPLGESPRAAEVYEGEYFPGFLQENKPDTYYLYLLSNAESEAKRTEALVHLFQTKNENLLSTVLGIAMDRPEADIRFRAVEKASDLSVKSQQKLKDTLQKMATSDPDEEVRQKAAELVSKYYPDK